MKKTVAIVGFGSRGQMFASRIREEGRIELVAIAEVFDAARNVGITQYGLPENMCFKSADEFFAKGKICDAIFLCTQDAQHKEMAIRAMELGYDMLLEKPAACSIEDCIEIRDTANRLGRKVMLTHGLRYAPFFKYIKHTILEGTLGDIVDIDQTENIAYWHFALSYVRGPWRNMANSSPTLLAKSCHDLDLIQWFMDKKCTKVGSFGGLYYFRPEKAPKGAAAHCVDCPEHIRGKCLYNSYEIYPQRVLKQTEQNRIVGGTARLFGRDIYEVIAEKEDIISKCIYHAGNDAIDNQVVNMQFEDGSTAHLTMTAFSANSYRNIKVHGTKGELWGKADENTVHVHIYGEKEKIIDVGEWFNKDNVSLKGGHGGGDHYLLKDFVDYLYDSDQSVTRTTIDVSIASHIIGFKAEESRLNGGKVMDIK